MPSLSKKNFVKSRNSNFKCPVNTKENVTTLLGRNITKKQNSKPLLETETKINNILEVIETPMAGKKPLSRTSSVTLTFSQSTNEIDSKTLNEPKMKAAYLEFVKNLSTVSLQSSQPVSSTPKCSQADSDIIINTINSTADSAGDSGISIPSEVKFYRAIKAAHELEVNTFTQKKDDTKKLTKKKHNVITSKEKQKSLKPIFSKANFELKPKKKPSNNISQKEKTKKNSEEKLSKLSNKKQEQKEGKMLLDIKKSGKEVSKLLKDTNIKNRTLVEKNNISQDFISKFGKKIHRKDITPKKEKLSKKSIKETDSFIYKKMVEIHESRNVGLYALCDYCDKARYLPQVTDPLDLPEKWYCHMNPDEKHNNCEHPEEIQNDDKDFLIDNCFNSGSIVWAKLDGYPWWPAMVEDDPDFEQYFWLQNSLEPIMYHVSFFDICQVTRAWIHKSNLKQFKANMYAPEYQPSKFNKYRTRVEAAIVQAQDAVKLSLIERLHIYSFIERYPNGMKDLIKKQPKKKNVGKKTTSKKVNDVKQIRKIISSDADSSSWIASQIDQIFSENEDISKITFNLLGETY